MTPKQKNRLWLVIALVVAVALAAWFAIKALGSNMLFFYSPSQVAAGEAPEDQRFRVGGLVVPGSVSRSPQSLAVDFQVSDNESVVLVRYNGILPDLFREGQGIIAHGKLLTSDSEEMIFAADKVLAKHDENYMPPEVAEALKEKHGGVIPFGEAQRENPEGAANQATDKPYGYGAPQ